MTLTHLIIASASATATLHCSNWKSRGDAAIYFARNGFKSIMEENPIYILLPKILSLVSFRYTIVQSYNSTKNSNHLLCRLY